MTSLEKKISKQEIQKLLLKYPNHIPIIANFDKNQKQFKFIVKSELTIMEFLAIFRKRVSLNSLEALWLYVNGNGNQNKVIMPSTTTTLLNLYEQYKNDDLVLLFQVERENTFGSII